MIETPDLVTLLRILARNLGALTSFRNRLAPARNLVTGPFERARRRTRLDDRRNIVAHYDLGDDFFELFLDPTMAYSCGVFEDEAATMHDASLAKFERICRKLELKSSDHIIEIGTGWGGFAVHAAATYGCRVTTTTISDRQFAAAQRRIAGAGLEDRVTVLNLDYRDLTGSFSHVVSIEMIEAVDWRDYPAYFSMIDRLLAPGGRAVLQCILIGDGDFERAKRSEDFLRRYIFPGGCLPSVAAINATLASSTALAIVDYEDIGAHYVRTLATWRDALESRGDDARSAGYDESFLRLWRFYLCYCEAAFAEGHVTDAQVTLAGPTWRAAPALRPL